ncbi:MAG: ABC transporter permease subunit [Acidobacteria bacterium]|nr:ABC transporter permease subunit [Acidobacteriota bacterium]
MGTSRTLEQRDWNQRRRWLLIGLCLAIVGATSALSSPSGLERIRQRGLLLWGADAEGGAPYVYPDPRDPSRLVGFEVEIAEALARELGVQARHVQTAWDTLPQALVRGDFDIALNGLEVTALRQSHILFTEPYAEFSETLMVRVGDQVRDLEGLKGRRVGTLKGALAADVLSRSPEIQVVHYDGQVEPYRDLAIGRLDAVLLDGPIARFYGERIPALKYIPGNFGTGYYAVGVRREDRDLQEALNEILRKLRATGELARILTRWRLQDAGNQPAEQVATGPGYPLRSLLPLLGRAALLTVGISTAAMALAILLGLLLCLIRMYGPSFLSGLAVGYMELFRGTPLLLQLLVIYFGLPTVGIRLPAWVAAILGLGFNYAAYESEIYRAGIQSVPPGQMDAALSLGMSQWLGLRKIVLPQAARFALPATTNDFIALFKDSSLCSVIGVLELTKQFNILAVSTWRVLELGILTALLYFGMSYPLSLLSRGLERRLRA